MKNLISKLLGKICVEWALRMSKKNWTNPYAQDEWELFFKFCKFVEKFQEGG